MATRTHQILMPLGRVSHPLRCVSNALLLKPALTLTYNTSQKHIHVSEETIIFYIASFKRRKKRRMAKATFTPQNQNIESFRLLSGHTIPAVGLGTWRSGSEVTNSVCTAIVEVLMKPHSTSLDHYYALCQFFFITTY